MALSFEQYQKLYDQSLNDPDNFWRSQAEKFISFQTPFNTVSKTDLRKGESQWFIGGKLNISYNCIDRHLVNNANKTAIIFEADEPGKTEHISYQQLHDEVCKLANALKAQGVKKGDRVCIYMPMVPQAAYAMLACSRIGAIHSVVFAGFSANALKDRIQDAKCKAVITADEVLRGGKTIGLKERVDEALTSCPSVTTCIVLKHTGINVNMHAGRDHDYHQLTQKQAAMCEPEWLDSEDPLFILYTSGSTGKPKGVLHHSAGYLLTTAITHHYAFDLQANDIFWCTADVGWITGHSYVVYGPLCNGSTTVMFEGVPNYPTAGRIGELIDQENINICYTAPTAIRMLMAAGEQALSSSSRNSLRVLGTVGEPISPEAWQWYYQQFGKSQCPVVDTWWQTETGGTMILPLPNTITPKPGAATLPFFGIEPALLNEKGEELNGATSGNLVIKRSWPGQIRSVYNNHQRLLDTYFSVYPGYYFTGDGAKRDEDGYYWITGRVDDVLNVSGHRLGTAEIEAACALHPKLAEAAVVGFPHDIKGEAIYVYARLNDGEVPSDALTDELIQTVVEALGAIARPQVIQWADDLPKTRSGKIMRRILRKIAANELDNLGDTSTLAIPEVIDQLIANRHNR